MDPRHRSRRRRRPQAWSSARQYHGAGGDEVVRIFISYRRDDSPDVAGRIRDRLADKFGTENVYYDVDSIPFGVDFRRQINSMVQRCDVLLVVIGPHWVELVDENGHRRLDSSADFVRLEVEAALARDIYVVPVLVHEAAIPLPDELPVSIQSLAYRNGLQVRGDPDFHGDMNRLVKSLTRTKAGVPVSGRGSALLERYRASLAVISAVLVIVAIGIWFMSRNSESGTEATTTSAGTTAVSPTTGSSLSMAAAPSMFAARRLLTVAGQPADLEMVGNDLWVATPPDSLESIDPATGRASPVTKFQAPGVVDVMVGNGEAAVTLFDGSSVGFVDLDSKNADTVPVDGGAPLHGATAADGFWFSCQSSRGGFLLHMANHKEIGRIPVSERPWALEADGDSQHLFVTFYDDNLLGSVDIATNVSKTVSVGESPVDVTLINGKLWVTLSGDDQVAVVDPDSLRIEERYDVGNQPWKLAYGLGSVWVTNKGATKSAPGSVSRLDPKTGTKQQMDIPVGRDPDEIAIASDGVYIANQGDGTISVLTPT